MDFSNLVAWIALLNWFYVVLMVLFFVGKIIIFIIVYKWVKKWLANRKDKHRQKRNCGWILCGACRNIPYGKNEPDNEL